MTNAVETIKDIIKNKVEVINMYYDYRKEADTTYDRFLHELSGMMICLKNINPEEDFYCLHYGDNRIEFGYYDSDSVWHTIA